MNVELLSLPPQLSLPSPVLPFPVLILKYFNSGPICLPLQQHPCSTEVRTTIISRVVRFRNINLSRLVKISESEKNHCNIH